MGKNNGHKLNSEQRAILLEWLAADYDTALILQWAADLGWPTITRQAIHYYRQSRGESVKRIREDRYSKALDAGLAQKAERIARLKRHADSLEAIKWVPDKNGRLWNEKAWRETLRDIAEEMGERKISVEMSWRDKAKQQGYDPDQLFRDMVNAARLRLAERSGGGSMGGSGETGSQ
jgi:hypothetical protein